jgi:threonine dehydratase
VEVHGSDGLEAELEARRVARDEDLAYVSPYNDASVIAGQGTVGVELERQLDAFDTLFVAVGGGGLISGVAGYLEQARGGVRVVACSPERSAVLEESVRAGRVLGLVSGETLSDGTAGGVEPGAITLETCRRLVDDWVRVSEEEIAAAMLEFIGAHHLLIEGAAGVAVAGFLKAAERLAGERSVVVICGGNISLDTLRALLARRGP